MDNAYSRMAVSHKPAGPYVSSDVSPPAAFQVRIALSSTALDGPCWEASVCIRSVTRGLMTICLYLPRKSHTSLSSEQRPRPLGRPHPPVHCLRSSLCLYCPEESLQSPILLSDGSRTSFSIPARLRQQRLDPALGVPSTRPIPCHQRRRQGSLASASAVD